MHYFKSITLLLLATILMSCNSTKSKVDGESDQIENSEEENRMMEAGFLKGTIVYSSAEGDCPYVIDVEDPNYNMFDPVNLDENYKADGAKIWFKFAGLKMPNRCDKANPINILEIQTRI